VESTPLTLVRKRSGTKLRRERIVFCIDRIADAGAESPIEIALDQMLSPRLSRHEQIVPGHFFGCGIKQE